MTNTNTELLLEGRIVCGHPMVRNNKTKIDEVTKQKVPVLDASGQQVTESYFALAIPKADETAWTQTSWGKTLYERAVQDWPNGEHAAPTFSWKITDGDSQIPNKVGKKPFDREGWPGHWIVHCSTQFYVSCYHIGKYDPLQQIKDEKEIKTGDYGRVLINSKGNSPSQSPGIYVNPKMFELTRAGQLIVSESGPSALEVFGGASQPIHDDTPQQQAVQHPHAPQPTPGVGPAAPVAPAPDLLQTPVVKYTTADGGKWTAEELKGFGFSEAQIALLPVA